MMTSRLLARWPVVLCLVLAPWAFSGAEAIATDETAATSPCDDGNPCTVDAAIPIAGCVHGWVIAGTACDDGNSCTQGDACDGAGTCIGQNAPAGAVCDDHNDCTVGESCDASGRCIGGAQLPASTCDDGNACTVDACDLIVGHCVHPPAATGTACDDRNGCTRGDACDGAGVCRGTAEAAGTVCDDGNSCTVGETCDGAGRCANGLSLPLGTACDDGDVCTEGETCMLAAGGGSIACQGAARDCDDGDLCTTDTCDRRTGECAHSGCDDGNACTADRCDPASGCVHDSLENQPCDDLDVCTTGERTICVNGAIVCGGGSPSSTAEFCAFSASIPDVQRSCQTVYCDRTRGCVTVVTCHPDSNQCTSDYCQFYQCHHDPLPAGASCDDGRLCTVSDICLDSPRGFCFGRPACDDDDPCTDDLCDPATGGCTHSSRLGQTCYWGFTKCSAGGV